MSKMYTTGGMNNTVAALIDDKWQLTGAGTINGADRYIAARFNTIVTVLGVRISAYTQDRWGANNIAPAQLQ